MAYSKAELKSNDSNIPLLITAVSFITLYVNRYNDKFLPLLWQFFFTPSRINKFVDLTAECFTSCMNQFCWNLIIPSSLHFFNFSVVISTSKGLGSAV
jgi:hypothetical protein